MFSLLLSPSQTALLAFSPPSKVSPFRNSNQDKGLPVLAS